jgi:hypothetical protein
MATFGATAAAGQEATTIEALRSEIETLRRDYEARITDLEARLAALEGQGDAAPPTPGDELARIREAAREAATAAPDPASAPIGRERNLSLLNPEISVTGIVVGTAASDGREEFDAQEFELDLQSALDPFSRTRVTLAFREGEVEIEEGYLDFNSLPGGLGLLAGRFRQRFGPLNRQHLHGLPQSDYPLVFQTYFGEEGLAQTGLSMTWLPSKPWASANELTLEVTNGENEEAFGGELFEDFSFLGRLTNFWDLSPATYLEWGLSGVTGQTADGGDSRVWGSDLTIAWQPPGRAKYRGVTWRTELMLSERDDPLGVRQEAWGGYTYVEGLVRRNLYFGVRGDRVEDPLAPDSYVWGVTPYLTWWQSEYVRLRAEYGYLEDGLTGESTDRFTLQLTWAAGPHKHETY